MTRSISALAVVCLTLCITLALYSLSALTSFSAAYAVFPQILRTTGTALGLVTGAMGLVASAQARRWRLFTIILCLVILTPYSPYLMGWAFSVLPAFSAVSEQTGLRVFLLSYAIPTAVMSILVLVGAWRARLSQPSLGTLAYTTDELEVTPLDA
jgi:hypothetical protein